MRDGGASRRRRNTTLGRTLVYAVLLASIGGSAAAVPLAFTGSLRLEISGLTPVVFAGVGVAEVVTMGDTVIQFSLPAGIFAGTAPLQVPAELSPIVRLDLSISNAAILLSAAQPPCDVAESALACLGSGPLHGRAGLEGQAIAGLLGTFSSPLTTLALLPTPIGGGGSFHGTNTLLAVGVRLLGAGWTTGTAVAFGTLAGSPDHTLVATGGAAGGPAGALQLVTPFAIRSDGGDFTLAGIARIEINLVPEPGTAPLVALGLVALALGARRHLRG